MANQEEIATRPVWITSVQKKAERAKLWVVSRPACARAWLIALRTRAAQTMRELTSKPRAVLIGASLTTILLSLVVILGLAYIVSPLPDSSQKQGVVATLASMVTPNDMIFTLPAPTVVTHDLSCPWLKDTRTKTCNGQRGYKVVGTSLISCGGCTDYTTPDTKKAGVQ